MSLAYTSQQSDHLNKCLHRDSLFQLSLDWSVMPSSIHSVAQSRTCTSSLIPQSVSLKFNSITVPCGLPFQSLFVSLWYLSTFTATTLVQAILISFLDHRKGCELPAPLCSGFTSSPFCTQYPK